MSATITGSLQFNHHSVSIIVQLQNYLFFHLFGAQRKTLMSGPLSSLTQVTGSWQKDTLAFFHTEVQNIRRAMCLGGSPEADPEANKGPNHRTQSSVYGSPGSSQNERMQVPLSSPTESHVCLPPFCENSTTRLTTFHSTLALALNTMQT